MAKQMTAGSYDARAIANLMLDEADREGIKVTNLALQKLLYFAHGIRLRQTKTPLVSGYFEAWQYGPVHPAAYRAFKSCGATPISFRAAGKDPLTGRPRELKTPDDGLVVQLVRDVVRSYGRLSPGRLVDLSHAKNSPWHYIVDKARTDVALGMRIPDNVIQERFHHHKVSAGEAPRAGEPEDDTPFA
ncbi:Panacea domain-containing protein [Ruegeria sp. HKCCA4008]|uniref:type VI toxin-antitoxin system SocA family antitoxin n=1 Tax=Ruegeria sp. HKCCA4008 TaxID=2682999 RepID=UPI0035302327